MEKHKPFYFRKRFITIVIIVAFGIFIGLNFKSISSYVKETAPAALEYAKQANPLISGLILGAVGIIDSSFLSLPEGNDILLVTFSYIKPVWTPWFVFISALGSLIGSLMLFSVGRKGGKVFSRKKFSSTKTSKVKAWFEKYDIWAILIPCMIPPPMPFKVFVLTAGVLKFSYPRFMFAVFVGRMIRYGIWGILTVIFREHIEMFMREYLLSLGIVVILLMVLVGSSYFFYQKFTRNKSQDNNAPRGTLSPNGSSEKVSEHS